MHSLARKVRSEPRPLSIWEADERLRLILAKLPPITFPQPLPPLRTGRHHTQQEFESMRKHFREALWKAQAGKCAKCEERIMRGTRATLDHVQPLSRGGLNWIGNLLLMHPGCNQRKADNPPSRRLREMLDDINFALRCDPANAEWFR